MQPVLASMQRTQSLPFGCYLTGIGFAGCLCVSLLVSWYYFRVYQQPGTNANRLETAYIGGTGLTDEPVQPVLGQYGAENATPVSSQCPAGSSDSRSVDIVKLATSLVADRSPESEREQKHQAPGGFSPRAAISSQTVPYRAAVAHENKASQSSLTAAEIESDREWLLSLTQPPEFDGATSPSAPDLAMSPPDDIGLETSAPQGDDAAIHSLQLGLFQQFGAQPADLAQVHSNTEPIVESISQPHFEVVAEGGSGTTDFTFPESSRGSAPPFLTNALTPQASSLTQIIGEPDDSTAEHELESPMATSVSASTSSDTESDNRAEAGDLEAGDPEPPHVVANSVGEPDDYPEASSGTVEVSIGDTPTTPPNQRNTAARIAHVGQAESSPAAATNETAIADEVATWPLPETITSQLAYWVQSPALSRWAEAAIASFDELDGLALPDPRSEELTASLEGYADQLLEYINSGAVPAEYVGKLSSLAWQMKRRAAIWQSVARISQEAGVTTVASDGVYLFQALTERRAEIEQMNVTADWIDYLKFDRATLVFGSDRATDLHRRTMAREMLSRATSLALAPEQRDYAQHVIGPHLGTVLRTACCGPVELSRFLDDLESLETDGSTVSEARVNDHFQNFYWSQDPSLQALSGIIDQHYRNANFRLEISDRLINRVATRNMTIHEPVQDRILGAQVFGNSRIQNQITVELIPSPDHLSFRLNSRGIVQSRTRAHASGFVFNNLGNALVNASKGLSIGTDGVSMLPAEVAAESQSRLLNVRSRLDGVPLVGQLARNMAEQQQRQQSSAANQVVEQKLRSEFGTRVDEETRQLVLQGQQWVRDNIISPFGALDLEPLVTDMRTASDHIAIRYRLAGLDQNAANSVRPNAAVGSLLSAQIHESAVNNLINRMEINSETFTPAELMHHVATILGRADVELEPEDQHDAKIQFASRDGIRLDFDDERLGITLRLKRLYIPNVASWRNITVTAWYFVETEGLQIRLRLDESEPVALKGSDFNLRDEIALRTIFNSLFKPDFEFSALPEDLANRPAARNVAISEIVLHHGWVSISVSDALGVDQQADTRRIAPVRQALQNSRLLR